MISCANAPKEMREFKVNGTVEDLYRYPIKGLSAQPLEAVSLIAGEGFPLDRAYGFAHPKSGFNPDNPKPLPKTKFVMLAREETLALLDTNFDSETGTLSINADRQSASFDITTQAGRTSASRFLSDCLGISPELQPTLHSAKPHRFTDVSVVSPAMMNAVSLINLDSVAYLSEQIGHSVEPARFRGNILFSGFAPFSELDLVGKRIAVGDVQLKVVLRTKRCPATQVNPHSGKRDLDIPKLLQEHFGHSDMGVYAEVECSGTLRRGAELRLIG
tara:strand:+ start:203 stop:1024 length:822 start_codon:yes stop_codon:yes gene_type:complete